MRHFFITLLFAVINFTILFQQAGEDISFTDLNGRSLKDVEESEPEVELVLPETDDGFSWGSQVRYSISVNDETDGASKYDEISPQEVFLEINFYPENEDPDSQEGMDENIRGLTLMGRSSCFGCHADKSTMIGPSFADMADAYNNDEEGVNKLVNSIRHGSTGVWRDAEMPAHPDISEEDAAAIAEYILTQGAQKYSWVYRGLEGLFQVIDKPQQIEKGNYILIASYTSSEQKRGVDKKVLNIE